MSTDVGLSTVVPHLLTYSGVIVNPFNPCPDKILIDDIIHSLSLQCRFNGHCREFYSVAEHSVLVSKYCDDALWGLLHDASEAYLCDIPRHIKRMFGGYYEAEERLQKVIAEKFGLCWPMPKNIKQIDSAILLPERDALMSNSLGDWSVVDDAPDLRGKVEIACWTPDMARHYFWKRFRELT